MILFPVTQKQRYCLHTVSYSPTFACSPSPVFILGVKFLDGKQKINHLMSVLHHLGDPCCFLSEVYFSFFPPLKAEFLALATRDRFTHKSSSFKGNLWKPIQLSLNRLELRDSTGACVWVCVCSHCTSFPGAVHSYKPCSVFIDAVYFVLYQINNKTQTRPEEQKRKVIHSWVEPIYIRRSALGALCSWPCIFAIMHLRNNNRNILTNKRSEAAQFTIFVFFFYLKSFPHFSPSYSLAWMAEEGLSKDGAKDWDFEPLHLLRLAENI